MSNFASVELRLNKNLGDCKLRDGNRQAKVILDDLVGFGRIHFIVNESNSVRKYAETPAQLPLIAKLV